MVRGDGRDAGPALAVAGLIAGLTLAVVVTTRVHRRAHGWGTRLGSTRLRRGDLPVGALVATVALPLIPATWRPPVGGAAVGLLVGVLVTAATDPLPAPARSPV